MTPDSPTPRPVTVNSSPFLDSPNGWGSGYALATGHGPGVVVGPGSTNPNVLAQSFPVKAGQQFKILAQAASVEKPAATAAIQINWHDIKGKFISVSQEHFKITATGKSFQTTMVAPSGASHGIVYVVAGGNHDAVRYTEMSVIRLEPVRDFLSYEFAGIQGQTVLGSGPVLLLLAILYYFTKSQLRTAAKLIGSSGNGVAKIFAVLALVLCGSMFFFLEGQYEQHYDSSWHQSSIDNVLTWNDRSLDLGGNAMHNFGIQHVIQPALSPGILIGNAFGADHRLQIEGALQSMMLFAILVMICRLAGAALGDACAISLVAVFWLFIPDLSDHAITLNATLGLKWQTMGIVTLMGFFCFALIGYKKLRLHPAWPIVGLVLMIAFVILAYTELLPFFAFATAGLCAGALFGSEGRRELLYKFLAAAGIIIAMLVVGLQDFVLNLFLYTPQMYYKTLYNHDFTSLFINNTSLLMSSRNLGGVKIVIFFLLASAGIYLALRFGNSFARRMVFGAISLELAIHVFSAVNAMFRLVPLTITYIEQMGLAIIALLAGTALWGGLRMLFFAIVKYWSQITPDGAKGAIVAPGLAGRIAQTLPFLVLLGLVAAVFYRMSIQTNFYSGWPPRTDSAPSQVQARELAIRPGDEFKGKAAVLLGMANPGAAMWGHHFFPIIYFKIRDEFGNDLMNDAKAAGIPVVNEYGHWISPPMLALLATAFYQPGDHIDRAAQAPREYRANLARLLGVALVVSDQPLPNEIELYRGNIGNYPLYMYRLPGANLGQYSPTRTVIATNAGQMLDYLQTPDFDGKELAVLEAPLLQVLVPVKQVSVSLHKGPKIRVQAYSEGTSLLVLPFDYSHCLEIEGEGLVQMIPVNLAQTGLVVRGKVALDISYRYGLIKGTACRKKDLERIKKLDLEEAATGRLFHDSRPARSAARQ